MKTIVLQLPFTYAAIGKPRGKRTDRSMIVLSSVPVAVPDITDEIDAKTDFQHSSFPSLPRWPVVKANGQILPRLVPPSNPGLNDDIDSEVLRQPSGDVLLAYEKHLDPSLTALIDAQGPIVHEAEVRSLTWHDREKRLAERSALVAAHYAVADGYLVTDLLRPVAAIRPDIVDGWCVSRLTMGDLRVVKRLMSSDFPISVGRIQDMRGWEERAERIGDASWLLDVEFPDFEHNIATACASIGQATRGLTRTTSDAFSRLALAAAQGIREGIPKDRRAEIVELVEEAIRAACQDQGTYSFSPLSDLGRAVDSTKVARMIAGDLPNGARMAP